MSASQSDQVDTERGGTEPDVTDQTVTDQTVTDRDDTAGATTTDEPSGRRRTKGGRRRKSSATAAATTAAAGGADAGGPKRTRRSKAKGGSGPLGRTILTLGVLAVLLAVVLLVELVRGPAEGARLETQEDRREAARQAAENAVPRLYSYDYRQIDADIATQERLTVGRINEDIRTKTAPALKSLAPKTTAVVQAVVLGSAATDDAGPDVKVLVFLNQAVSSNLLSAPRLDRSRVLATMQLVGTEWKVADVQLL